MSTQVLPSGVFHSDVDDQRILIATAAPIHLDRTVVIGDFAPNRTLSTPTGTISCGLEASNRQARWTAASRSATVDASGKSTSACNSPGADRHEPIDHLKGCPSMSHFGCSTANDVASCLPSNWSVCDS